MWHHMTYTCLNGPGLRTPAVARTLGVPLGWIVGLEDDFVFSNGQKVHIYSLHTYRLNTRPAPHVPRHTPHATRHTPLAPRPSPATDDRWRGRRVVVTDGSALQVEAAVKLLRREHLGVK